MQTRRNTIDEQADNEEMSRINKMNREQGGKNNDDTKRIDAVEPITSIEETKKYMSTAQSDSVRGGDATASYMI